METDGFGKNERDGTGGNVNGGIFNTSSKRLFNSGIADVLVSILVASESNCSASFLISFDSFVITSLVCFC